jgi:large repetitive protein
MSYAETTEVSRVPFRFTALAVAVLTGLGLFLVIPARQSQANVPATLFAISPTTFDFGDVPLNNPSPEQAVTVTNVSGVSQMMNGVAGLSGDFGGRNDCQGVTLAAGASCHMYYHFTTTTLGSDTFPGATGSWLGQQYSLNFTGNGINQFSITPTGLDFGNVPTNSTSAAQAVTITNVGSVSAVVSLATSNDTAAFPGATDCGALSPLAPGASCALSYEFAPTTGGEQTGSPTGTVNGQPFSLSLAGNALNPTERSALTFLLTPTSFDFGDVPLNNPSTSQVVTVTNISGSSVVMDGTDGGSGVFAGSNNCEGETLIAGGTCQMDYAFTPTALGVATGTTDMGNWNGQSFSIGFTGTGINQFLISPTGFDFGDVAVGTTSASQSVVVKNVGITAVEVGPGGLGVGAPWDQLQGCKGAMLAQGETCAEDESFAPTTTGPQSDSIDESMSGQAFSVFLAGNAVTAPPPPSGPTITGVSPSAGPTSGGTSVTITGTGFTGATTVRFGSLSAMFALKSSTKIVAKSPPQSAGTRDISVKTPGGTSAAVSADRFTYVSAPRVTFVSPSAGPTSGGTSVTITGTGFTGASTVRFGSVSAMFALKSSTEIVATSPAQSAGTRDVSVKTPGGTSAAVSADRFTYQAAPNVTKISPSSGPKAGGTSVTITGTGFTGATTVRFGSVSAMFALKSSTEIVAVAPAQSAGTRDISVKTPGGTSAAVTADRFTYH